MLGVTMLAPGPAYGDGWHNATLMTNSLDQWLSDAKAVHAIPERRHVLLNREILALFYLRLGHANAE